MDIEMLELRRCGQQNIGVIGGICLEMLENDREQILSREACGDFLRIGCDRDRVRVIYDDRLDLGPEVGIAGMQQRACCGA